MFLASAKKVIVLISERVGDAVFCTPAIAYLKKMRPELEISILALSALSAEVYQNNPAVKEIIIQPTLKIFIQRCNEWDVLIDLQNSNKTLEYVVHWQKTAYLSPRGDDVHQSLVALEFVRSLVGGTLENFNVGYYLYPTQKNDDEARALLEANGVDLTQLASTPLIGCHMGCYKLAQRLKAINFLNRGKLSRKTWALENFSALQKKLYKKYPHARLVLTGSPVEEKLIKNFDKNIPNLINLYGKTSVLTLTALMKYLNVFLTGDTGPLHLAASTQAPVVAMFFGSNPRHTGPYPLAKNHHVLFNSNPAEIKSEMVLDHLKEHINVINE